MSVSKSVVDMNRLRDGIDDHAHAVATMKKHRKELNTIAENIRVLDTEITDLKRQVSDRRTANNSIDLEEIKNFSRKSASIQLDIESLIEARDELKAVLRDKERDYSQLDVYAESDCITTLWQIIYDGYLKSVDIEPLNQLITLGTKINKPVSSVVADLKLVADTRMLEAFAKQYNLPAGAV
jgi:regulator of replication initiation timing